MLGGTGLRGAAHRNFIGRSADSNPYRFLCRAS